MNEVIKNILERRSIRKFTDEPLPRGVLEKIVEAGRHAPNAWNSQSFKFYIITSDEVLNSMAEITAKYLGGKAGEHRFFGAKQIILIADLRENPMGLANAGCAAENIMLAARSLGVGSVWINQFSTISDKPDVVLLMESIGVSRGYVTLAVCALGFPDYTPEPKEVVSKVYYV